MALETRYIPFGFDLCGKRWSGDWSVTDKRLCVRSAYGSAEQPLGRRKPERLAEELLKDILREWCGASEARDLTACRDLRVAPTPQDQVR